MKGDLRLLAHAQKRNPGSEVYNPLPVTAEHI